MRSSRKRRWAQHPTDPRARTRRTQTRARSRPIWQVAALDLSGNRFEDQAMADFIRTLGRSSPALQSLDISGPKVQTGGFAQSLGCATAAALAACAILSGGPVASGSAITRSSTNFSR